jgi:hypothetical protein
VVWSVKLFGFFAGWRAGRLYAPAITVWQPRLCSIPQVEIPGQAGLAGLSRVNDPAGHFPGTADRAKQRLYDPAGDTPASGASPLEVLLQNCPKTGQKIFLK